MAGGQKHISISVDTSDVGQKTSEAARQFAKLGKEAKSSGASLDNAMKRASSGVEDMTGVTKQNLSIQKDAIKQLESQMKQLNAQIGKVPPGDGQVKLKAEAVAVANELEAEKRALVQMQEAISSTETKTHSLRTRLREMRDALIQMEAAGERGTETYNKIRDEYAKLTDAMADASAQGRILAHDQKGMQGLISGFSGLAGAASAAQGAIGLVAGENEDLQKIMLKVQSLMAIAIGLQQVEQALNKDSAFMLVTVAGAKRKLATANAWLASSLRVSNGAAKALMATLSLGLSVAIGAVIYLIDQWSTKQQQAAEAQKRALEDSLEAMKAARQEQTKATVELNTHINKIKDFNGNKRQEKGLINELNSKYGETFGQYKTLAKWYDVLTGKGGQYVQTLYLQAKAQALIDQAMKKDDEIAAAEQRRDQAKKSMPGWWSLAFTSYDHLQGSVKNHRSAERTKANIDIMRAQNDKNKLLKEAEDLVKQSNKITIKANFGGYDKDVSSPTKSDKYDSTSDLREMRRKERDLAMSLRQAAIDGRKEGFAKELAQIELEREKKIEAIDREEEDLLLRIQAMSKAKWEAGGKKGKFVAPTSISAESKSAFDALKTAATEEEGRKTKELQKKTLEQYQTYEQRKAAIIKQFEKDRENIKAAGGTAEQDAEILRLKEEALKALNAEIAERSEDFKAWASSVTELSLKKLQELLQQAKEKLKAAEESSGTKPEELAVQLAKVDHITKQVAIAQAKLNHKDQDKTKAEEWGKTVKMMNEARTAIGNVASGFDNMDEGAKSALNAASNVAAGTIAMIVGIRSLAKAGEEAIKGVERASVILAVISAALQIVQTIANLFGSDEAVQEELAKKRLEMARSMRKEQTDYNRALFEQNLLMREAQTIFGEASFSKAKRYFDLMVGKGQEYQDTIARLADESRRANDAFNRTFWGKIFGGAGFKNYTNDLKQVLASIQAVTGEHHEKTGFLGLGKGKYVKEYQDLLSLYPDLIDAEGKLNIERAKSILANRELAGQGKELLEDIVAKQEQAEKAADALREHLTNTFGKVGGDLADSIIEAVEKGGDAWDIFQKKANNTMRQIAQQLLREVIMQRFVKDYTDKLLGAYKTSNDPTQIARTQMGIVQEMMGQWAREIPGLQDLYRQLISQLGSLTDDVQGSRGIFEGLTQEQGNELGGLMRSQLAVGYTTLESVSAIQRDTAAAGYTLTELRNIILDSIEFLRRIETNTYRLHEISRGIDSIKRNTDKLWT